MAQLTRAAFRLTALVILLAPPAAAQLPEATEAPPRPAVGATERTGPITIDGSLDEAAWQAAPVINGFVQRQPLEGAPATAATEVRILYDADAVYIAAWLHDASPGTIARQLVRRDEEGQYDWFEIGIDPNRDRRTGYRFRVSAANVQRDEYLFEDGESDEAWNAVWHSAVQIDGTGWLVEMRIPLTQILYTADDGAQTWGVNLARRHIATNELSELALVSQLQRGVVSQFADLTGLVLPHTARRFEARPYALSRVATVPEDPGNPLVEPTSTGARTGVDLRYGLGGQFTLHATVNPDFGQVEADPAVINLTAFETFFPEQRPFFVEDARLLDFSLSGRTNRLFYTRRLGRRPRGASPPGADYANRPDATAIRGAVKLTGRTGGGLSIGALTALTRGERGRAYTVATDETRAYLVEPATGSAVVRLQQDFAEGASTIGAIVTGLRRDLPGDGTFDNLPASALAAGIDWDIQWGNRTWGIAGYLAGTHVRGDSTALIRIQRASNHYFQRPDALWVSLDSSATTMTGFDWRVAFEKRRGRHWTGSVWFAQVSPGFEVNDLGFSSRQEVLDGGARVSYREIRPGRLFRGYSITAFMVNNWSHDALRDVWSADSWGRAHLRGSWSLRTNATLLNYWRLEANVSLRPEAMDRTASRGGPLVVTPRSYNVELSVQSDARRRFTVAPRLQREWSALGGGDQWSLQAEMVVRPSSRVELTLGPAWERSRIDAQFVGSTDTLAYLATFGRRYLFGEIRRNELAMVARLNVVFTPNLSLQLFAQPFLSSGDYVAYKQLVAPGSYDFLPFAEGNALPGACMGGSTCEDAAHRRYVDFDGDGMVDYDFADRDFNVRSLIGNVVLRWEYGPGSTVFLVWQRQQEDEVALGSAAFGRDLSALWRAPSRNTFIVKVNYWLSL